MPDSSAHAPLLMFVALVRPVQEVINDFQNHLGDLAGQYEVRGSERGEIRVMRNDQEPIDFSAEDKALHSAMLHLFSTRTLASASLCNTPSDDPVFGEDYESDWSYDGPVGWGLEPISDNDDEPCRVVRLSEMRRSF